MRCAVTRRKAAAWVLSSAAMALCFAPDPGIARTGQPARDPLQSRRLHEISQQGEAAATKPAPRMPRLAAPDGPADAKPIVVLKSVTIEGARELAPEQLAFAFEPFIGAKVSQADLVKIAADITDAYRGAGFHLSRAIIPPQDLRHGRLRIHVIEGDVAEVALKGEAAGRFRIPAMLAPITAEHPSRLATFERQLLLVNDLPGVRVADVALEEIGTGSGKFRLTVAVETWTVYVASEIENSGSVPVGPLQTYASGTLNSLFAGGDALTVSASAVPEFPQELAYGFVSYDVPVGVDGFRIGAALSHSTVWPGDERRELGTRSQSTVVELRGSFVPLQTQRSSLRLTVGIGGGEFTEDDDFGTTYPDRVRTASVRADYFLKDDFGGRNYLTLGYRKGIGAFGASPLNDALTSRWDASGDFSIVDLAFTRIQTINDAWSLKLAGAAQFAPFPLFSAQQFYLGASAFGRGYDPGAISGDNGVAASAELRLDRPVNASHLRSFQVYVFADAGTVWDNEPEREYLSLVSTGFGIRGYFADSWQAGMAVAVPVSTPTSDLSDYPLRFLFSVSKSLKACPGSSNLWCG